MSVKRIVIFGWADSIHVQRWARGLQSRGYHVRVISSAGKPIDAVDTIILPRKGKRSYLTQTVVAARSALEFQPDLVHVHYAGGFGLWGLWCRFSPMVVSVWGADIIGRPLNPLRRLFVRRIIRAADHVTATSQLLKKTCINLVPQSESKLSVIPFGVELPNKITSLPSDSIRLCFIKNHRCKYGPDILLRAMTRVVKEIPDIRLTMAGHGKMTPRLMQMTREFGLETHVDFVGHIDNQLIYPLLEKHHIMVMPSVDESESFGVAVLEASACGRPVIASRIGGVPEVLQDGVTGLLVPPGDVEKLADAIVRLARDRKLLTKMGHEGYRFVEENYTWDKSLDLMTSVYECLIHRTACSV